MAGPLPITGPSARILQVPLAGNVPSLIIEQLHRFSLAEFVQGLIDARTGAAEGIGTTLVTVTGPEGDTLELSPEGLESARQEAAPPPPAGFSPQPDSTVDFFA